MFFSVLHVPLFFIYGGDFYVQEFGDVFNVFFFFWLGGGVLGNPGPKSKYKTQSVGKDAQ